MRLTEDKIKKIEELTSAEYSKDSKSFILTLVAGGCLCKWSFTIGEHGTVFTSTDFPRELMHLKFQYRNLNDVIPGVQEKIKKIMEAK